MDLLASRFHMASFACCEQLSLTIHMLKTNRHEEAQMQIRQALQLFVLPNAPFRLSFPEKAVRGLRSAEGQSDPTQINIADIQPAYVFALLEVKATYDSLMGGSRER